MSSTIIEELQTHFEDIPHYDERSLRKIMFNGWKPTFDLAKQSTSALMPPPMDDSDNPDRIFKFIITSEDVDDDGEIPSVEDFADNIDFMMKSERGVMVSVVHTDMLPGKVLSMEKMTLGEVLELHPDQAERLKITPDTDLSTKCIYGEGKIFKSIPELDDYVWHLVKTGKLNTVSLRGVGIPTKKTKCDSQNKCGVIIKNTRIWALTLSPDGQQASPRAIILEKRKNEKELDPFIALLTKNKDNPGEYSKMEEMDEHDNPENAMAILKDVAADMKIIKEHVKIPSDSDNPDEKKMGDPDKDPDAENEKMGDHESKGNFGDGDNQDESEGDGDNDEDTEENPDLEKQDEGNDEKSDSEDDGDDVNVDVDVDTDDDAETDDEEEDDEDPDMTDDEKNKSKAKTKKIDPLVQIKSSELNALFARVDMLEKQVKTPATKKVDVKAAAQEAVDAKLAEYGIKKTKTPDPDQTEIGSGTEKGDPTGGSGDPASNADDGPSFNEVTNFYLTKMNRQPNSDELKAHLIEGIALPKVLEGPVMGQGAAPIR